MFNGFKFGLPGPYENTSGGPVDPYYLFRVGATEYRPYVDLAEACANVPISVRKNRTVNVADVEHVWLSSNLTDAGLAIKVTQGAGAGGDTTVAFTRTNHSILTFETDKNTFTVDLSKKTFAGSIEIGKDPKFSNPFGQFWQNPAGGWIISNGKITITDGADNFYQDVPINTPMVAARVIIDSISKGAIQIAANAFGSADVYYSPPFDQAGTWEFDFPNITGSTVRFFVITKSGSNATAVISEVNFYSKSALLQDAYDADFSKKSVDETINSKKTYTKSQYFYPGLPGNGASIFIGSDFVFSDPGARICLNGYDFGAQTIGTIKTTGTLYLRNGYNADKGLHLNRDGNVAIGKEVGSEKLDVEGAVKAQKIVAHLDSTANDVSLGDFLAPNVREVNVVIGREYSNANSARIGYSATGNAFIAVFGRPTYDLNVAPSGNVGVGVENPTRKLHVGNGDVYFQQSLQVDGDILFYGKIKGDGSQLTGIGKPKKAPVYPVTSDGSQIIPLGGAATDILSVTVLEAGSSFTKNVWDDYCTINGTNLEVSVNAGLKSGDKVLVKFYA